MEFLHFPCWRMDFLTFHGKEILYVSMESRKFHMSAWKVKKFHMSAWKVRKSIRQHGKWRNSIRQHGSKKLHASAWTATSYVLRNFYVLCNIWNFLTHSDYFIHADVCSFVIWNSINIAFHADVWNFFKTVIRQEVPTS
jgi:hypothetical protein